MKISANRWELKINKGCEFKFTIFVILKITKIVHFQVGGATLHHFYYTGGHVVRCEDVW